jgi:hypothetical protein
MRPSGRLFLDPSAIYNLDPRARQRAKWLVEDVSADVDSAYLRELSPGVEISGRSVNNISVGGSPTTKSDHSACVKPERLKIKPFPKRRPKNSATSEDLAAWKPVAGVAEIYPRLLAWLAEGRAGWHWNLFGGWIAVLRLIPGLRWILWHFLLEPVARRAPWRFELQEAILQDKRYNYNVKHRDKSSTTLIIRETPGLSAVTDVATITQTATCNKVREKIEKMSSGCIGVSGFRGSGHGIGKLVLRGRVSPFVLECLI